MWQFSGKATNRLTYTNTTTGETCFFNKIYTHPELGQFYMIDSVLNLPYQRKYLFDLSSQMEKIGMEKDELLDNIDKILTILKEKKQGFDLEVFAIASKVRHTIKDQWDYKKTALFAATLCIIQEGDNINGWNQSESVERISLWEKDPTMLSFFLSNLNKICTEVTKSYGAYIPTYSVTESQPKEK